MTIKADAIVRRIDGLKAQRERLTTAISAVTGAIQDSEYWLALVTAPDDPTPEPATTPREEPTDGK